MLTGITAQPTDFHTIVHENECRRYPFAMDTGQIFWPRAVYVNTPQRCTRTFFCPVINNTDLLVPALAPGTPRLLKHDKLGRGR